MGRAARKFVPAKTKNGRMRKEQNEIARRGLNLMAAGGILLPRRRLASRSYQARRVPVVVVSAFR